MQTVILETILTPSYDKKITLVRSELKDEISQMGNPLAILAQLPQTPANNNLNDEKFQQIEDQITSLDSKIQSVQQEKIPFI